MSIGENIKKLRKSMGLTQVQLAEKLSTTQKVITDYETGRSEPPRKRLPHFARFFNITVDELIGDDELQEPANGNEKIHHGNSRSAHVIKLFDCLGEEEQRVILKQIKALQRGRNDSELSTDGGRHDFGTSDIKAGGSIPFRRVHEK